MNPRLNILVLLLASLMAASHTPAQQPAADPYQDLAKYQFGQPRLPLALIDELIRKTSPQDYPQIEAKLLAVLESPQSTTDAKRFICRWLSVVGSAKCIPAVASLLTDKELSHLARFALEPMRDPAAGAALRDALPKVKDKLLAGVISSIGVRRDPQAVPSLTSLAQDPNPLIASAAISALGEIGTVDAVKVLDKIRVPDRLSRTLARAKISAAGRLTLAGQKPEAVQLYRTLVPPQQPQAIRTAALNGLIGALPQAEAVSLIIDGVQSEDVTQRTATVAAFASAADKNLKTAVVAKLPDMKPPGQLVLLRLLADQSEVSARPGALAVVESATDPEVKMAALECLVRHGEPADVALLVRLAHGTPAAVADAARKVLERMGHPGVDTALTGLIESASTADRAVVLSILASRQVVSALPTLARLVTGTDPTLAIEAAKALGLLGKPEQLPALAAALTATDNPGLRAASEEAAQAICRRTSNKETAAQPLLGALSKTTAAPARSALLRLLAYTGGDPALAAVRSAIRDTNPETREAAIRALVAWPDASAAADLINLARTAEKPTYAVLALRDGSLRLAQMETVPLSQRLEIYRDVLKVAQRPDEKKQAVAGLGQLPAPGALELLQTCAKDPALKTDAVTAIIRLAKELGAVENKRALAALEEVKSLAANDVARKEVENAITAVRKAGQSPEGFIVAWMLSGPYLEQDAGGSDVFTAAFAPEKTGLKVEWRPATVPPNGRPGMVEFDKIWPGDNRAAYLKTQITSDRDQDALLEIGSDDGVKVWLNGQLVHSNNAVRPCTPNQDKAKIKLKQGLNTLLMKVTQGGGQWAACCRVRSPDGKELSGVTVALGE